MSALVCLCTCPSEDVALSLARGVVEAELAACVNVVPGVRSIYRWEGRVNEDAELLLVLKTTAEAYPALQAHLLAAHPYTCPEVLALPVAAGSEAYLAWLHGSVSAGSSQLGRGDAAPP